MVLHDCHKYRVGDSKSNQKLNLKLIFENIIFAQIHSRNIHFFNQNFHHIISDLHAHIEFFGPLRVIQIIKFFIFLKLQNLNVSNSNSRKKIFDDFFKNFIGTPGPMGPRWVHNLPYFFKRLVPSLSQNQEMNRMKIIYNYFYMIWSYNIMTIII